jgi:hypothetical protein
MAENERPVKDGLDSKELEREGDRIAPRPQGEVDSFDAW